MNYQKNMKIFGMRYVLMTVCCLLFILLYVPDITSAQSANDEPADSYLENPVQVMVFGVFHFNNPGRDAFNPHVPDVLTPQKQKEIKTLTDSLARFRPDKIAIEDEPKETAYHDSLYQAYLNGQYSLKRYEWEQVGFRLAARLGHNQIYPIDHEMNLPFGEMLKYAKKHDTTAVNFFMNWGRKLKKQADSLLENKSLYEALKLSNSTEFRQGIEAVRARMMTVGTDTNHVGADLQARWHKRNMRIFANLEHIAEPGDRILVIFGGGHSAILRELVRESRRMKLVEPLDYF